MTCNLCPRRCNALRDEYGGLGYCRSSALPRVARAAAHFWEEPCISGKNGSGTVFFAGCNLGCAFCQNYSLSHEHHGKDISVARLADIFRELEDSGVHNVNLVNPTHYTYAVLEALDIYRPSVPVVWNSGGYESIDTLGLLRGAIDIFLPDMKYHSDALAYRYAACRDYFEIASQAIAKMRDMTGLAQYDHQGMMSRGTMVRHLVLPTHTDDTFQILKWYKTLPATPLSLMAQFTPFGKIDKFPELARKLSREEYDKVVGMLAELDIDDGFVQQLDSADAAFIPPFDLSGV